jgi:hypothetical protein
MFSIVTDLFAYMARGYRNFMTYHEGQELIRRQTRSAKLQYERAKFYMIPEDGNGGHPAQEIQVFDDKREGCYPIATHGTAAEKAEADVPDAAVTSKRVRKERVARARKQAGAAGAHQNPDVYVTPSRGVAKKTK